MTTLKSITLQQWTTYQKVAQEAVKSPEISGEYGRDWILDALQGACALLNPSDMYLQDLKSAVSLVIGNDMRKINDSTLQGTVNRQVITPFFEELEAKGSVDPKHLTLWMAIWIRDRDAELRGNIRKYVNATTLGNLTDPAERTAAVTAIEYNQITYTTAIIRRVSNLVKAKYPDKVVDMDVIYAGVSKGQDDIKAIAEDLFATLQEENKAGEVFSTPRVYSSAPGSQAANRPLDTPEKLRLAYAVSAYLWQIHRIAEIANLGISDREIIRSTANNLNSGKFTEQELRNWIDYLTNFIKKSGITPYNLDQFLPKDKAQPTAGVMDTQEELAAAEQKLQHAIFEARDLVQNLGTVISKARRDIIENITNSDDFAQYITVAEKDERYGFIKGILDFYTVVHTAPPVPAFQQQVTSQSVSRTQSVPYTALSTSETKSGLENEFQQLLYKVLAIPDLDPSEKALFYDLENQFEAKNITPDRMRELIQMFRDVILRRGTAPTVSLDLPNLK